MPTPTPKQEAEQLCEKVALLKDYFELGETCFNVSKRFPFAEKLVGEIEILLNSLQLESLLADRERLDWLDKIRVNHIYDHFKFHASTAATEKTWRTAITTAMEKHT